MALHHKVTPLPTKKKRKVALKGKKAEISGTRKTRIVRRAIQNDSSRLWPEEEKALEEIMTGKKKMVEVSGEDLLRELKTVINE